MRGQPHANGATAVAGQVVGDEVEVALWIGVVKRLEQREVARSIARGRRLGQHLPVPDAQRAIDPDLVGTALRV